MLIQSHTTYFMLTAKTPFYTEGEILGLLTPNMQKGFQEGVFVLKNRDSSLKRESPYYPYNTPPFEKSPQTVDGRRLSICIVFGFLT